MAAAVRKPLKGHYSVFGLVPRPDPADKVKVAEWSEKNRGVLDDPRSCPLTTCYFTRSLFTHAGGSSGYVLWPRPFRLDLPLRDQVDVGDEGFCWALCEVWYECQDKNYWASDTWYKRYTKWCTYVHKCRSGDKDHGAAAYLKVENEATAVSQEGEGGTRFSTLVLCSSQVHWLSG